MFKELVEHIAKSLVDNPDQVVVEMVEDPASTTLRLKVAPGDLGRVIGKQGRTARAMRTLLHATAARAKRRVVLEIVE
ncbi:MAG TPA: KH domain-containing protein [Candidatus Baltobacteraceae bacterium]|nr:KH domain-containing protein [Candidatus Baltobacteraceae bacterium]